MNTNNEKFRMNYALLTKWQRQVAGLHHNREYDGRLNKAVMHCGVVPLSNAYDVRVSCSEGHSHFKGLQACRNLWHCPVCTPRMMKWHALKIGKVLDQMKEHGFKALMATFTIPHYKVDSAKEVLDALLLTLKKFYNGGTWANRHDEWGITAKIEVRECTYGENGFHFHAHAIYFVPSDKWYDMLDIESVLKRRWYDCFERTDLAKKHNANGWNWTFGQEKNTKVGVHFSRNADGSLRETNAGTYIAQMQANELTMAAAKRTHRETSRNLFELLTTDDPADLAAFTEYAMATHQKQRLLYSRVLWKYCTIDKDELWREMGMLVEKKTATEVSFGLFNWYKVIEYEINYRTPVRFIILELAATGNAQLVVDFCATLDIYCEIVKPTVDEQVKISA